MVVSGAAGAGAEDGSTAVAAVGDCGAGTGEGLSDFCCGLASRLALAASLRRFNRAFRRARFCNLLYCLLISVFTTCEHYGCFFEL